MNDPNQIDRNNETVIDGVKKRYETFRDCISEYFKEPDLSEMKDLWKEIGLIREDIEMYVDMALIKSPKDDVMGRRVPVWESGVSSDLSKYREILTGLLNKLDGLIALAEVLIRNNADYGYYSSRLAALKKGTQAVRDMLVSS
jgi:hypothetical protein